MEVFILLLLLFLIPGSCSSCPDPVDAPREVEVASGSCLYIPCRYQLCQPVQLGTFSWLHLPSFSPARRDFVGREVGRVQQGPGQTRGSCALQLPRVGSAQAGTYGLRLVGRGRRSGSKLPWMHLVNVSVTASPSPPRLWPSPSPLHHGLRTTLGCWLPLPCPNSTLDLAWTPLEGPLWASGGVLLAPWSPPAWLSSVPTLGTSLTLTPSWHQDGTSLTCSLLGPGGEVLSQAQRSLQIHYAPQEVQVELSPGSPIQEGQEVTLSCRAQAKPPSHTYGWSLNGERLPQSQAQLHLSPVRTSDGGLYSCWATNSLGSASSPPASLEVLYPPRGVWLEVSPRSPVHEGQEVTLACRASANPQPHSYGWSRRGQPLANQEARLVLGSVEAANHRGSYRCWAANGLGVAWSEPTHLEVYYPPRGALLEALTPLPAPPGQPISLRCTLGPAHPAPPAVQWLRDDAWQQATPGHTLTFPADPAHAGSYRCGGRNPAGSAQSPPLRVTLWAPPSSIRVQQLPPGPLLAGGGPILLRCLVGGAEPPPHRVTWYKDGRPLTFDPSPGGNVTFDPETFDLTLGPPLPPEASSYSCRAQNLAGEAQSRALELDVLFPPQEAWLEAEPSWAVPPLTSVLLRCRCRSRPPPSGYLWSRNGLSLAPTPRGLRPLPRVGPEAAGAYRCGCSHPLGASPPSPPASLSLLVPPSPILRRTFLALGVSGAVLLLLGALGGVLWHRRQKQAAAARTFCVYRQRPLPRCTASAPPPPLIGCQQREASEEPHPGRSSEPTQVLPWATKADGDYQNLPPVAPEEASLVYASLALAPCSLPPAGHPQGLQDPSGDYLTLRH